MPNVAALSVSKLKGVKKDNVPEVTFLREKGIEGDAHSGGGIRQVSLLAMESITKIKEKGLDVGPGDFAENITTEGIILHTLPLDTRIILEGGAELILTQIGKVCHDRCAIYHQSGDCVMPREGVFCKVVKGGKVKVGAEMEIFAPGKSNVHK